MQQLKDHEVELIKAAQVNLFKSFPVLQTVDSVEYTRVIVRKGSGEDELNRTNFYIGDASYEAILDSDNTILNDILSIIYVPSDQINSVEPANANENVWKQPPVKWKLNQRIALWFQNFVQIWVVRRVA